MMGVGAGPGEGQVTTNASRWGAWRDAMAPGRVLPQGLLVPLTISLTAEARTGATRARLGREALRAGLAVATFREEREARAAAMAAVLRG